MVSAAVLSAETSPPGLALRIDSLSHALSLEGAALPVLQDVSLTVEPGAFVALLGPSGCGKSTLLRLVAGLERPSRGQMLGDGVPIENPHPSRVVVLQDPTLFPWRTVAENIALGPEARGEKNGRQERVDRVIRLVGLSGFEKALPHQLSGGMAQRVALGRAVINRPRLLILDEPFSKLDSLTRLTMQTELLTLWRQDRFTTLLVTHDVEEALMLAGRIVVLSPRPARILTVIENDLPYPRHRDDPALVERRRMVLSMLGID
jgi:NitT/TauT family transport system ATP-binding protein